MIRPLPWDHGSDQPARVKGPVRQQMRRRAWGDWAATAAIAGIAAPLVAARWATLGRGAPPAARDALGVGVSPLDQDPLLLRDLLDELDCPRILVRFEWRRMHRWDALRRALDLIGRPALAVLVQDRPAVVDHRRWRAGLARFYRELPDRVDAVQALQAVNRLKWGCATVGEALPLAAAAGRWHRHHAPRLPLVGGAVIDFEPLASLRSVVTGHDLRYDAVAALLYVDRRGGPEARQYGCFDLRRKIGLLAAIAASSPHVADPRLWLTEVNWPLTGQRGFAPTSHTECVDEATAGRHLGDYCRIALATGSVRRIYPWQLVARGYGLVDPEDRRRRPAFDALRDLLAD